jgi:hypothetical protein
MAKIKIEDLSNQACQELSESELSRIHGGIKDGTSNTFLVGESYAPYAKVTEADGRDFLVWQRQVG